MSFKDALKKEMNADERVKNENYLSNIRQSVYEVERGIKDIILNKSKSGQFKENNGKRIISGTFYLSQVELDTCEGYIRRYLTHVPIIILNSKIKKAFLNGNVHAEYEIKLSEEMESILLTVKKNLEKEGIVLSDFFIESKPKSIKQNKPPFCIVTESIEARFHASINAMSKALNGNTISFGTAVMYGMDIGFDYIIEF